jgi:uncharacterized protein (DUF433 family)
MGVELKRLMETDMVEAPINLIGLDECGVAYIAGTRMKVAEIVRETIGLGYAPETIVEAHSHLTLAQVHAALSYYYDHRDEIDAFQQEQDAYYAEFCARHEQPISREELEARRDRARTRAPKKGSPVAQVREEGGRYS